MSDPTGSAGPEPLLEFADVMRRLRAECPWQQQQTHRSLVRYLLEESYETAEAIESGTPDDVREELGDLLLQVYLHAAIAEEAGAFTLDEVAAGVSAKMRRRNPHVFADEADTGPAVDSAAEASRLWEEAKAGEKTRSGLLDGVPTTLPALLLADKALDRFERAGTVPSGAGEPEPSGTQQPDEEARLGAELFALVRRCRAAGVDPEQALRSTVLRIAEQPGR